MLVVKAMALLSSAAVAVRSAPSELLLKRDKCDEGCPPGQFKIQTGDCTFACVQQAKNPINVVSGDQLVSSGTMIVCALIGAWAHVYGGRHAVQVGDARRNEDPYAQAFQSVVDRLSAIGGSSFTGSEMPADSGSSGPQEVDYDAFFAKWTHDDQTITLNNTEVSVQFNSPQKRGDNDQLTGYKVTYHNAKVDTCFLKHDFSDDELQDFGHQIFQAYADHASGGRSSCSCLRWGHEAGWAAALTIEGEANDNGKYDHIRCDCDWSPGLRSWWDWGCPS